MPAAAPCGAGPPCGHRRRFNRRRPPHPPAGRGTRLTSNRLGRPGASRSAPTGLATPPRPPLPPPRTPGSGLTVEAAAGRRRLCSGLPARHAVASGARLGARGFGATVSLALALTFSGRRSYGIGGSWTARASGLPADSDALRGSCDSASPAGAGETAACEDSPVENLTQNAVEEGEHLRG